MKLGKVRLHVNVRLNLRNVEKIFCPTCILSVLLGRSLIQRSSTSGLNKAGHFVGAQGVKDLAPFLDS